MAMSGFQMKFAKYCKFLINNNYLCGIRNHLRIPHARNSGLCVDSRSNRINYINLINTC